MMEAAMLSPDRIFDSTSLSDAAADYEVVRRAIGHIRDHWRDQPEIEAIAEAGEEQAALADMKRRWPKADYVENTARTARIAQRVFDSRQWRQEQPLRVVLIGTDWEVRVWETLLRVPMGRLTTYSGLARKVSTPAAARAVGAAVGRNPLAFVVPCHRVIGKAGELTGYHWGLTRKRAMLGWEAGQVTLAA